MRKKLVDYGFKAFQQGSQRQMHSFAVDLYKQHKVAITEGDGVHLKDGTGKSYIDFHGMYGAVPFGHAPQAFKPIFDKVFDGQLPMTHGAFPKDNAAEAAKKLAVKTARCLGGRPEDKAVYFNNTGAEAVEAAFKFSRFWGTEVKGIPDNDKIVVSMTGNFHGRTVGTHLFDGKKKNYQYGFGPLMPGIGHIEWNDSEAAEKYFEEHGSRIASVIIEPIQGEGGINMPTQEFMKTMARLCDEHKVLVVADEVQAGLHRAGPFWASKLYEETGFKPHIIASAKALGGGVFPVGGVIMDSNIAELLKPGMHGSTFGGNNIAMAVVNTVLDEIENQNIEANVAAMSKVLQVQLQSIQNAYPEVVTGFTGPGVGLWRGIEVAPDLNTHQVVETFIQKGVITGESGRNVLRIAPPLNVKEKDLTEGCERIAEGIKEISRNQEAYRESSKVSAIQR